MGSAGGDAAWQNIRHILERSDDEHQAISTTDLHHRQIQTPTS
jgi:hypothetical protein